MSHRAILLGPLGVDDRSIRRAIESLHIQPGADSLIGVDGGVDAWRKLGYSPDLAVGDWDSIGGGRPPQARGTRAITLPRKKDRSDLFHALSLAMKEEPSEIACLGLTGGRPDHHLGMLSDLSMLSRIRSRDPRMIWAWGPEARYIFLSGVRRKWSARLPRGSTISIFCLSDLCRGVSLKGMEYGLKKASLRPSSQGVSNRTVSSRCEVRLSSGRLVVIIPFRKPYGI